MSEFCKQCAEALFDGLGANDLAGLTTEDETKKGIVANVICEGCGFIQVNHLGECVSDCGENHKPSYPIPNHK